MFSDDIISLATETLEMARAGGFHIATAESCTGGLIMGALTEIAGSSDVVDRGFVTYTNRAKRETLKVDAPLLREFGAVSEQVACAMAEGAIKNSSASHAVSVTGIAGPGGGSEGKPVGLVHMAAKKRDGELLHERHVFSGNRCDVRLATVKAALELLQRAIV